MEKYELRINNTTQTIQGVKIKNKQNFIGIRSAIEASFLEGWKPNVHDIQEVVNYVETHQDGLSNIREAFK